MNRQGYLNQFARHTPRLLRRQLILQLTEVYLGKTKLDGNSLNCCQPSIQRFQGALLFVDISGFTVLSQKLTVEELKNHINDYFTIMLDIVDKHEGDVIKFAERAVECGKEINERCGNHKVTFSLNKFGRRVNGSGTSSSNLLGTSAAQMMANFHKDSSRSLLTEMQTPSSSTLNGEECAYLNVHSGVSVGLMAGVDIGADNRWEYFLIGEPLSKVAEAEGQASSGDLIICPESHALLHPQEGGTTLTSIVTRIRSRFMDHRASSVLPCGCTMMKSGYCAVKTLVSNGHKPSRRGRKSKKSLIDDSNSLLDNIERDINDATAAMDSEFKKKFELLNQIFRKGSGDVSPGEFCQDNVYASYHEWIEACLTDDVARHVHHALRSEFSFGDTLRQKVFDRDFEAAWKLRTHRLSDPPLPSMAPLFPRNFHLEAAMPRHSLLSPIVSAPNSARGSPFAIQESPSGVTTPNVPRHGVLSPIIVPTAEMHSASSTLSKNDTRVSQSEVDVDVELSTSRPTTPPGAPLRINSKIMLRGFMSPSSSNLTASLSTELRNVTVMFVKIMMTDNELLIDASKRVKPVGCYHFLGTTLNENLADQRLLNKYQKSIEVLSGALTSHGGQMRQFIVDDKGTVCIGTFGLRGSVSDDNAAAALDAAHTIIVELQQMGLQCSIGVTVGRAYCGLVGSSQRHEYAVMGPSTNLSARLMGKAPAYGVICDLETKQRDRTHGFVTLGEIAAKGYSTPVGTFKPIFPDVEAYLRAQQEISNSFVNSRNHAKLRVSVAHKITQRVIKSTTDNGEIQMQGRSEEVSKIIEFAFNGLVYDTFDGGEKDQLLFDHRLPTHTIAVFAADGMGKSMLATAVTDKVFRVSKHTRGYNVQLFKSRVDGRSIGESFNAWRSVIMEIITRLYRMGNKKPVNKKNDRAPKSDINDEVAYIVSLLPQDVQHLYPLFGYLSIGFTKFRAESVVKYSPQEKTLNTVQLLLALLDLYSMICKRLIFITMEDVQTYDSASLCLIHAVAASSKGVVLLLTGRTSKRNGVRSEIFESGLTLQDFTAPFNNSDQYLEIELQELSRAATSELVANVLQSCNVTAEDVDFYDRVFDVSGGNPLYAYEIAQSYANSLIGKTSPVARNARTEEVICYRFDQLKTSSQALLKMVAVICSNMSTFSLSMLTKIEDWDLLENNESFTYPVLLDADEFSGKSQLEKTSSTVRTKYATILLDILQCESFIRRRFDQEHQQPESFTIETLVSCEGQFEFAIPLEQSTIYNLLLDDQKQTLHEAVAQFFQRCKVEDGTENTVEEGFHWQKAAVWSKALLCSHKLFEQESDRLKRIHYLEMSFQAVQGLNCDGESSPDGLSFDALHDLFEENMKGVVKQHDGGHEEGAALSLHRVYEMFRGDPNLLVAGVTTLIHIGILRKHRFENALGILLVMEDALQIALLTKNPTLMNAIHLQTNIRPEVPIDGSKLSSSEMHFCLPNFWPLFLRVMSSYCMNYIMSTVSIVEYSRKANYVAEQFLAYARSEGTEIDLIQALCVNSLVQNKLSNLKVSLQYFEELKALYVFEVHSSQLVEKYGADHLIYVVTRTIKYLVMSDKVEKSVELISSAIRWFNALTHIPSLTLTVLRLVSVLAYLDRVDDALALLSRYSSVAAAHRHSNMCVPLNLLQLFRSWLELHLTYTSESLPAEELYCSGLIKQFEMVLLSNDKHVLESNPVLSYHKLDVLIVFADLFAMKMKADRSNESGLTADCMMCCKYLQNAITSQIVDTHDMFCQARTVGVVKLALHLLSNLTDREEHFKGFRKVFTERVVSSLRKEAQVNQLIALNRDVVEINLILYNGKSAK